MSDVDVVELIAMSLGEADELVETVKSLAETRACVSAVSVDEEQSGGLYARRLCGIAKAELDTVPVGYAGSSSNDWWYSRLETVPGYGWWQRQEPVDHTDMLMTVFAMRFPDKESRNAFIEATRGHGDYCWENEPDTQVYGLGIVVEQKGASVPIRRGDLVVVMICTDQRAIEKHQDDPQHLALGGEIAALRIPVENNFANTYQLMPAGFLWR